MAKVRCFLCAKQIKGLVECFDVEISTMPASQKSVQLVLQHLASCIKIKLIFQSGACVCTQCFKELSDYDNLMLNLLASQRRLTSQLHNTLNEKAETASEGEQEMESIELEITEDSSLADAFNPELDAKEELIEVDDSVVEDDDTYDLKTNSDSVDDVGWIPGRKRLHQECVVCGTTFKSKFQLQNHIIEAHNAKQHTCKICGVVRKDEEYLELHMNIHEGKTENECRYCPKRFSRPVNTLRHMRIHWDKKKFQCEKCGERFSLDNMLYNHRLRHEAEENPLICSICNQSFKSRKTYNHHMLIHQENRPRHYCTLCPKSFTERYTLKQHFKIHTDSSPIKDHKETEAAINVLVEGVSKEFCCVICSTKFLGKDGLEEHLQEEHDVILK